MANSWGNTLYNIYSQFAENNNLFHINWTTFIAVNNNLVDIIWMTFVLGLQKTTISLTLCEFYQTPL